LSSQAALQVPKRFFFGEKLLPFLVDLALNLEFNLPELKKSIRARNTLKTSSQHKPSPPHDVTVPL